MSYRQQAVFHTLCSADFLQHDQLPHGIILTGKGYPDLSTRELVKRLSDDYPSYVLSLSCSLTHRPLFRGSAHAGSLSSASSILTLTASKFSRPTSMDHLPLRLIERTWRSKELSGWG